MEMRHRPTYGFTRELAIGGISLFLSDISLRMHLGMRGNWRYLIHRLYGIFRHEPSAAEKRDWSASDRGLVTKRTLFNASCYRSRICRHPWEILPQPYCTRMPTCSRKPSG